ncbi:MAG: type IV secretory system conjugative DNA transfer family protein [Solirubrobacteraceae bacterium]
MNGARGPGATPPPPLARRPWWLAPALLALLLAPGPIVIGLIAAAMIGRLALAAARSQRARRLDAAAERAGVDAVVLGTGPSGRRVLLSDLELSAHGLIVGASGAGKSTTLLTIVTEQIRRGRPVVAIDLKGSPAFARRLESAATAAGRRLRVWTPDGPERWNPLACGNATELKDKLIATERFSEPHYQRAAERYIQLALQVMREADPKRELTLASVVAMMEPKRLAGLTRKLPPERASYVRDYLAGLTGDQQSAIRGLASRLAIISESHTGAFLGAAPSPGAGSDAAVGAVADRGAVDLRAALSGREVVLFSLNSSTYGKLAGQLGTLAVQDLVTAVGYRLESGAAQPAIVAIDEFSALGSDNLMSLLARGREAGVSVMLATQELADLDRAARGMRDQVLGNTAVKIAHRQDVPESARALAQMAGSVKRWERTYNLQPGRFGGSDARRGTLRLVDTYAVDPEQIRTLAPGDAILISKLPRASTRALRVRAGSAGAQSAGLESARLHGGSARADPRSARSDGPIAER